jgi:hypothetical protein
MRASSRRSSAIAEDRHASRGRANWHKGKGGLISLSFLGVTARH